MYKYLLKLDLDNRFSYDTLMNTLTSLVVMYKMLNIRAKKFRLYISSNKKGYHLEILISVDRKLSDLEIVLLQSILGDDPRRSIHNYYRILKNKPYNVLFNTKNGKRRIYLKELSQKLLELYEVMINFSEKIYEKKKKELYETLEH